MGRSPSPADNVKTEFAFGIFSREVNFSGGCVYSLGYQDELVNKFLHAGQHFLLWRKNSFSVRDIDRPFRKAIEALPLDMHTLPHFLHPHQIPIITIPN